MPKEISFGSEATQKLFKGIEKAYKAVAPTLGAIGKTAIIDWEGLDPIVSDDGVTILKNLEFKDKYENIALKMLRKAAVRTSVEGGDGTATTTVLAKAIIQEAFKEVANNSSRIREVVERLQKGLSDTLAELSNRKREVREEDIEKIATISSLDKEIATMIAEVIKEIGVNGVVTVERGSGIGYSKEIVKGVKFNRGFISPYFVNEPNKERCVLDKPYIFLANRAISLGEQIKSLMDSIHKSDNKSILIIADDVNGIALASLIQSCEHVVTNVGGQQMRGTYKVACVKNPYTGTRGMDFLFDVAALTGGTVINEEAGMRLDNSTVEHCGTAEKVIITNEECTIIGGDKSDELKDRIDSIEEKIKETTSEYERGQLEERLASLTGGMGIIRVGTYTDTDFNAKKYKFDNAINSTQAALQEGILPGGGVALAKVSIDDPIFRNALTEPLKQQAINAGMEWHRVLASVEDLDGVMPSRGYNFVTKEPVDMFEAGIIDPFKVTRLALESAVSIASMLITADVVIVNELEDVK